LASDKVEIEFVETSPMKIAGYTLIEGFPGMGLIGTISAKYIVEKLGFRQAGYLDSDLFVPIIRVHEGLPVHPSRIYVNDKHKLVILISEQIIPQFFTRKLSKAVVDWVERKKICCVISLSGIRAVPEKDGKEKIYGIASNETSKKLLKKHSIEVIKEGITSGITALLMLEFRDRKIDAISLMGNVQIAADYKSSVAIVEKLSEMFGLNIDTEPLLKEAKETEKALMDHFKQLKETSENVKQLEDSSTTLETPMYT
jgi:uncharacterized protein